MAKSVTDVTSFGVSERMALGEKCDDEVYHECMFRYPASMLVLCHTGSSQQVNVGGKEYYQT